MSKHIFLKGAMILTIAGIIVKIIGAVNRIILSRMLGGEGIGLYQLAYPVYILALSFIAAGIPIAISILIAEKRAVSDWAGARKIFHVSLKVFTAVGLGAAVLFYVLASQLLEWGWVRDERAYLGLIVLAPALFFGILMGCFRGYFQGYQLMLPTAISQIADQFFRVLSMIGLAWFFLPWGLEYAAAGAAFGAVPGTAAGLLSLLICYRYYKKSLGIEVGGEAPAAVPDSAGRIAKRLLLLMIPVSMANIMMPAVASIDLVIVPNRLLAAGYTIEESTALFGYLTGMATSLVNLPAIVTAALAAAIVPAVSKAFAEKNYPALYRDSNAAMRIMNVLTMPMAVGIAVLGVPISQMLYATPHAGAAIGIMAWGIWLLGLQQVSAAILQGMGHTTIPLLNMIASAIVKIALSWHFTAIYDIGIQGAAWATNIDLGLAAALNMYFLKKYSGYCLRKKEIVKLGGLSLTMGAAAWGIYTGLYQITGQNTGSLLTAIGAAVILYAAGLIGGRLITPQDAEKLPKAGNTAAKWIRKIQK